MPHESLGRIETWAAERRHPFVIAPLWAGAPLPQRDDFDWLVVMGGPMSVHAEREHPWLVPEKRCIEAALRDGKRILGVCLGAQLVASVLGARVFRSPEREVGWWPVRTTAPGRIAPLFASMPAQLTVLHWHEDTFELPAGAALLAGSEACRQQAFAFGERVLCLQFHLEMSPGDVRNLVGESTDMLVAGRFVQRAADILAAQQHFAPMYATLDGILERFALEGRDSPPERAPSATGSS